MITALGNTGSKPTAPSCCSAPASGRVRWPMRRMWSRKPSCATGATSGICPEIHRPCLSHPSVGLRWITPVGMPAAWLAKKRPTAASRNGNALSSRSLGKAMIAAGRSRQPCSVCLPASAKFSSSRSGTNSLSNKSARPSKSRPIPPPRAIVTRWPRSARS